MWSLVLWSRSWLCPPSARWKNEEEEEEEEVLCGGLLHNWGPFSAAAYHTKRNEEREKKRPVRLCRVKTVDEDEEEEEEEERTR